MPDDTFALPGPWTLDYEGATSDTDASSIKLNLRQKRYIVVGGTGNLTVTHDGKTTTVPINGPPSSHQIVGRKDIARGLVEVRLSPGVEVFSFTYG